MIIRNCICIIVIFIVAACGGSGGSGESIELNFNARIAGDPIQCGENYEGIGLNASTISIQDFRFYIHNIVLLSSNGEKHPLSLLPDGQWQSDTLALIDFESAEGACASQGTPETNTRVIGKVNSADFSAVEFTIGVPFEINHIDAQTADAPQNLTAMWWNWNAGYKFFKFDVTSAGLPDGWRVHLGSTGCSGNQSGAVEQCANPNLVTVRLDNFDPRTNSIGIELAELLAGSNVDYNTPQTAPGCMSGATDPECGAIFTKLGFSGDEQSIFYVE